MDRRKFIAGVGSLAAGSAAVMGSGAFSSSATERDVSVSVTGDAGAYLGLEAGDSPHAYQSSDGELKLDFDGSEASGAGINTDAFTKFNNLFTVRNNSPNGIAVYLDVGYTRSGYDSSGDGADGANLGKKLKDQLDINPRPGYPLFWTFSQDYDPFGTDGGGNEIENGLDDKLLNFLNIPLDIFNYADAHPAVLRSGEAFTVNFAVNTGTAKYEITPSEISNLNGTVELIGYTKDFADRKQS